MNHFPPTLALPEVRRLMRPQHSLSLSIP